MSKPGLSKPGAVTPGDRLELIETFIRIAELGGIGAAARSLDAAQPTVTRRLQQLEALLNAKLFERGPQGLSPTPICATLLPEARELAQRWKTLEQSAGAQQRDLAGTVRVLAPSELGAYFLPPLFAEFLRRYPEVRLEARFRDGALDLLSDGADFALVEGKPGGESMTSREVGRSRMVLAAAPDVAERLAQDRGLVAIGRCEPLALEGAPLISIGTLYGQLVRFKGRSGETVEAQFDPIAAMESADAALTLTLEGCGLAVLPDWRIAPFIENRSLVRVASDWIAGETPVALVWAPTRLRTASATALLEMLRAELPGMLGE